MTRILARLGLVLLLGVTASVMGPTLSAHGAITCVRYPGTVGGTVRVGPVEIDVPATPADLVGVCWDSDRQELPRLTAPKVTQYAGCGTPCFSAYSNLHVPGRSVAITIYANGSPQTYGPFGFDDTDVPVCITFGDPEPSC